MSSENQAKSSENRVNFSAPTPRRAWESPRLSYIGHVAEILQSGGGKLSVVGGDPGEMRKQGPAG